MPNFSSSTIQEDTQRTQQEEITIPASLKFVVSNIKSIVSTELNQDNYAVWRSQILKIFSANGFAKFLDSSLCSSSTASSSSSHSAESNQSTIQSAQWKLMDQNLSASLCSTISASILPYVINLTSTASIWSTLENRFQATNRSKVLQLKNALHNISIKNLTMNQYLTDIKILVDQITAAGASIDNEDIIMYILNGLSPQYQAFKTAFRTMLTPITLDQLYPLLLSEEINLASDAARNSSFPDPNLALYTYRGRGRRNRGRSSQQTGSAARPPANTTTCQICLKKGHSASDCWHRMNAQYVPQVQSKPKALVATSEQSQSNWFLDSGATAHLTNSLDNLHLSSAYTGPETITVGDGRSVNIANSGVGLLPTPTRKLKLSNILHSPELRFNLLSISKLTRDNHISITFNPTGFVVKDLKTQETLLHGPCKNGLYPIQMVSDESSPKALVGTTQDANIWHQRLGHPHDRIMKTIANKTAHFSMNNFSVFCSSCKASKSHKRVFEKSLNNTNAILDLVHSDVWGPAPVTSNQGFRYYVLFVDDFSRFSWIFPMRTKTEVLTNFIVFRTQIEKYTSKSIKIIRTDGGMEYVNHDFKQYLQINGIAHQISCPYTPEQNGVSERKHRHIIETTRTLLHTAAVPYTYWPEAVLTSIYLINRMPSSNTNQKSPFEILHQTEPRYDHLRTFGCECFYLLPPHTHHKLQPKSKSAIFIGYSDTYKGYKCLDPSTNKIYISRHTEFNEHSFPFQTTAQKSCPPAAPTIPFLLQPHSKIPTHSMITRAKTGSLKPTSRFNLLHVQPASDEDITPTNYNTAAKHHEWRTAMNNEFYALQKNGTWTLVKPPPNSSILGCKWTYRIKKHANGTIAKHKARLVAQGNHQEYGLDYTETFSPVAKLPTIRVLLTVALHHGWIVHQMDVANAFLHGSLTETVYMAQPQGFVDPTKPDHVCHLQKAIYGLKQAPRQWYNTFTSYLVSIGFSHSAADPSLLYFKQNSIQIFLLMYVDDILISGNNTNEISALMSRLSQQFSMKNLGVANDFLGIKIDYIENSCFLSQKTYAQSLLQLAQLTECHALANPTCTKMPPNLPADPVLSDPSMYRKITGSLQYLTLTRPDIAYSVNQLSQHMHNPLPQHIYLLK
ncbi:Retrovirus-related Pol polyprotein from transposon TNT 1-94 [Dendrobium catenatum]|uniref:Retrovirus-related Pol polyprotein from transposon TNT 1-94 n=1 Tax=Dendrobium catenatum TaxID=906689 RepID=A0A2I0XH30_9ASPA|nr:Retrovirus-related Pol polyprotein from transposon TNT 1-94 [Dendrobium catenatum]